MFRTFLLIGASAMALSATSAEALTFVYSASVQHYTVTTTGMYSVVVAGAQGGHALTISAPGPGGNIGGSGGQGIAIGARVSLTAGTLLDIVVGGSGSGGGGGLGGGGGGGGGGSFVFAEVGSPVVIAGGGGGGGRFSENSGAAATVSQAGTSGGGTFGGPGGVGGYGGQGGTYASGPETLDGVTRIFGLNGGGGAGLIGKGGNGPNTYSGTGGSAAPYFQGGHTVGAPPALTSGFGGGGGGGFSGGGGGGGFSGGGGGGSAGEGGSGGGGGSFIRPDATDVTATANLQADGNGFASIDLYVAPVGGVPEPATWSLLAGGFGTIGAAMRRRKRLPV